MTKMKKIILSILCACIMTMGCLGVNSSAAVPDGYEHLENEIYFLGQFGFIDEDFFVEEKMTRGEFVKVIGRILGVQEGAYRQSTFTDISPRADYLSAVEYLVGMGVINGRSEGLFYPGNMISYTEAIKILTLITGYGDMAQYNGGWPDGYVAMAERYDILDGVTYEEKISKQTAIKMFYNVLNAPVIKQDILSDEVSFEIDEDCTLLTEYHDVYKIKGVLDKTENTDLTGDMPAGKGRIGIGNEIYDTDIDFGNYLGYLVDAYVRLDDTSDGKVIAVSINKKNKAVTVSSEDIIPEKTSRTNLAYYTGESLSDTENAEISPSADMVLNSQAKPGFTKEDLIFDAGDVTLISYDGDDTADVVIVNSYETMVVESTSIMSGKIFNKYTFDTALDELEFDEESPNTVVKILKNGEEIKLKDIEIGDVALVAQSKTGIKKIIKILVSSEKLTAKIESYDSIGTVIANGTEYELSAVYKTALNKNDIFADPIIAGEEGTLYLDAFGRVAAYEKDASSVLNYGYLRTGWIDLPSGDILQLRILTFENGWQTISCAPKIKINDSGRLTSEKAIASPYLATDGKTFIGQMIRYKVNNEGQITEIQTATATPQDINTDFYKKDYSLTYRSENKSFDSMVYIDNETKLFYIPSEESQKGNENSYNVGYAGALLDGGTKYTDMSAYDMDEYALAKCLAIKRPYIEIGQRNPGDLFVYHKQSVQMVGDEVYTVLSGVMAGDSAATAILDESCDMSGIEPGDILKFAVNLQGRVYNITKVFDASSAPDARSSVTPTSIHSGAYIYGRIEKSEPSSGRILIDDGMEEYKSVLLRQNKLNMYIYDSELDRIYRGKLEDIERDDFIFTRSSSSVTNTAIIYR